MKIVTLLTILMMTSLSYSEGARPEVHKKARGKYVFRTSATTLEIDTSKHIHNDPLKKQYEDLNDLPHVSPDSKSVLFMGYHTNHNSGKPTHAGLVLKLNIENGGVTKKIYKHTGNIENLTWINPHKIVLRPGIGYDENVIYDLKDEQSYTLEGGSSLVLDSASDNYLCLYGDSQWRIPLHGPRQSGNKRAYSTAVRYNGLWVYPEVIDGWLNKDDYRSGDWSNRLQMYKETINFAGVDVAEVCYDISVPAFLRTGREFVFAEKVYRKGKVDDLLESNLVIISIDTKDQDKITSGDISIAKYKLGGIVDDQELSKDCILIWNKAKNEIEIWKYNLSRTKKMKLLGKMELKDRMPSH